VGDHVARVTADGASATTSIVALDRWTTPSPSDAELLLAWVNSSGGGVVEKGGAGDVRRILDRAVVAGESVVPWHPLRSGWWVLPFALALGAEWWWRRRQGLR
jgi:hypothetical protein